MHWLYREKRKGDDFSDPISGEFFADGSIGNPAEALVAEAIQNVLDAGKGIDRQGDPMRVRFGLYRGDHALPADVVSGFFSQEVRQHLQAKNSGIKALPDFDQPCDFLVVEDFGTSGLTGKIDSDDADSKRNNFVDFLRSDGRTRKDAGDRGSWGVGKNVFPRSSRINAFIAYTIRHDDQQRLAMGKMILRNRHVGEKDYQPPCYFGQSWNDQDVPRPVEDAPALDALCDAFNLTRKQEAGLSLVVPWVDPQVRFGDLLAAVIQKFAYAILAGGLTVTLDDGENQITLDRQTLTNHTDTLLPDDAAAVAMAKWSLSVKDKDRLILAAPPADEKQKWSADLVSESSQDAIRQTLLQQHERIAVRVPLHVPEPESSQTTPSHFDLYLEYQAEGRTKRPQFIRDQLAISGVKRAIGVPKVHALIVIDDKPIAELLRAAEPPNHTDWDMKTANFQKSYNGGNHIITFVKEAVKQLIGIVRQGEQEPDPTVAIDFFALPEPDDKPSPPSKKKKKTKDASGGETEPPVIDVQSKANRIRLDHVEGGFAFRPGEPEAEPYKRLNVKIAYNVFSGNAFKQYESADFDLTRKDRSGIQIVTSGAADYQITDTNRLQLTLTGEQYEVYVQGFGTDRDVEVVYTEVKGEPDA